MICPKCGSQLDADNKFCGKCGATIQKEPVSYPLSEGIPKQGSLLKKRKMIILTAAALLVIIAIIVIVSVYVQPSAQINRAISSGDIASAYVLYTAKCSGEPLEDSTLEALVQYAEDVVSRYENGEIPYGEAVEQLDALTSFAILSQELSSLQSSLLQEMSEKNSVAVNIADGHTASQSGDYLNAIQCYQRALNLDAESEEAQQGLSEAVDQYRNEVLAQVEEYSAFGDFSAAESALTIALDYLPEDEVLTEQLNGLDDLKIQTIVHEAYAAADGGDWDGAIGILQEAQTVYTSSQEINEAYEDILEEMPITLENITIVSSDEIEIYNEVVKDRWGNIYDDGVRIEGSTDGYILVALNQNFTKFTGTAFVVDSASIGKNMWFSVYLDEKLVYYTDGITEESQPISLEIDITGATTMRISVGNEGSFSNGGLIFGNTHFEKVPKSKETDESGQAS